MYPLLLYPLVSLTKQKYPKHIAKYVESIVCGVEAGWRGIDGTSSINRVESLDLDVLRFLRLYCVAKQILSVLKYSVVYGIYERIVSQYRRESV
jgi:hypothetical protein